MPGMLRTSKIPDRPVPGEQGGGSICDGDPTA